MRIVTNPAVYTGLLLSTIMIMCAGNEISAARKGGTELKSIDVYKQYFAAEAEFGGDIRRGASVVLNATSDEGMVEYKVCVSFFLHEDDEDFRISFDRYFEKSLFSGKGRRTRKRDALYMEEIRNTADEIAAENGAVINWDEPLIEARIDTL